MSKWTGPFFSVPHQTHSKKQYQIEAIFEFAAKYPKIIKLQNECDEIKAGKRNQLNQQTIDDAFDAFEKIVEELSKTEKESQELYKLSVKQWFCNFLVSQGVIIS